ncbi:MAG: DUF5615 family PIN-like protein [Chloroflexi bacterium]|nr:DUF5615 family PIN-like protein [Chloroflexota bacterium]
MALPAVYLDECVDHDLVAALRWRGYAVTSALEQGRANVGETDEAQLAYAAEHGWMLLTHNERHFRALHVAYVQQARDHGGLIIMPATPPRERLLIWCALMLDWIELMPDHQSGSFKWGRLQSLLEQGFRLSGYPEQDVVLALAR